jgi:MYXO-CTERM domain-containing protein
VDEVARAPNPPLPHPIHVGQGKYVDASDRCVGDPFRPLHVIATDDGTHGRRRGSPHPHRRSRSRGSSSAPCIHCRPLTTLCVSRPVWRRPNSKYAAEPRVFRTARTRQTLLSHSDAGAAAPVAPLPALALAAIWALRRQLRRHLPDARTLCTASAVAAGPGAAAQLEGTARRCGETCGRTPRRGRGGMTNPPPRG